LSGGFEVKYNEELGKGFIIKPYVGVIGCRERSGHLLNNYIKLLLISTKF